MDGRHAGNAGAFFGCAPGMARMQEMQEQFPAAAMDGRHAENAGAFFGCAPWMADMPETQEQFAGPQR